MAKRPGLSTIFAKTEPTEELPPDGAEPTAGAVAAPPDDRTVSVGVGLKLSELRQVDELADSLSVTRNNLLRYAILSLLAHHPDLSAHIEAPRQKRRLRMP